MEVINKIQVEQIIEDKELDSNKIVIDNIGLNQGARINKLRIGINGFYYIVNYNDYLVAANNCSKF